MGRGRLADLGRTVVRRSAILRQSRNSERQVAVENAPRHNSEAAFAAERYDELGRRIRDQSDLVDRHVAGKRLRGGATAVIGTVAIHRNRARREGTADDKHLISGRRLHAGREDAVLLQGRALVGKERRVRERGVGRREAQVGLAVFGFLNVARGRNLRADTDIREALRGGRLDRARDRAARDIDGHHLQAVGRHGPKTIDAKHVGRTIERRGIDRGERARARIDLDAETGLPDAGLPVQ